MGNDFYVVNGCHVANEFSVVILVTPPPLGKTHYPPRTFHPRCMRGMRKAPRLSFVCVT